MVLEREHAVAIACLKEMAFICRIGIGIVREERTKPQAGDAPTRVSTPGDIVHPRPSQ